MQHLVLPSFYLPTDIIEDLNHKLDAKWRYFGTYLRVDFEVMDAIEANRQCKSEDCMLELVGKWVSNQEGTGDLPRTWRTIHDAVKKLGKTTLAETLAQKHGLNLSSV